jgi:excinuclease ABC subunit A
MDEIHVRGAREHNLQNIDVTIPRNALTVITGVSGSGKSSLAFDTIYAEGQRRYVESLSAYARQFLGRMQKPDVDQIVGLSPAIAIEQRTTSRNPRSTVATTTEIYDYLRVLYARAGTQHCHHCGQEIGGQTVVEMVDRLLELPAGTRLVVFGPIVRGRKGEYRKELADLRRQGFVRVRVDGTLHELDEEIVLDKKKRHDIEVVVDRVKAEEKARGRIHESMETALRLGEGLAVVEADGKPLTFSDQAVCTSCGISFPPLDPRNFSFNSPYGACPECEGLGTRRTIAADLAVDPELSIADGALSGWKTLDGWSGSLLKAVAEAYRIPVDKPFKKLSAKAKDVLLHGTGEREIPWTIKRKKGTIEWRTRFPGVIPTLLKRYRESQSDRVRESIEELMSEQPCASCGGSRLRPESAAVRVGEHRIHELVALNVGEAVEVMESLSLTERQTEIAAPIRKEIASRLVFLRDVGLSYLTLDRASATLSGGEAQRIRLATQIGSQLTGVLYVLDEPSIGLHHRDNRKLLATLKRLRDLGNTVLVVEHDEETMKEADFLVDLGPGAGRHGGSVVALGTPAKVARNRQSLTGAYLAGRVAIAVPAERRPGNGQHLIVRGATENNLRSLDVAFPLGTFICVTGVSGSGKSTLVRQVLYHALARVLHQAKMSAGKHDRIQGVGHLDKVIEIDQSPIGRTPRSNPATYTGAFSLIRGLFAQLPMSRVRGYQPGRFSFNVKGGRCEACQGDGVVKIEMHFLPDVYVKCDACGGRRYHRETLEVTYRGKSIADLLDMTVEEAVEFLEAFPALERKLGTLRDVGLGYIHLGQAATTLSGGEAQRVKLATELSRVATGRTIYILDEPTTGLHFRDIEILLGVLQSLVDRGNTVVVIEHQLDVVKCADHIIDLGPEGGSGGGALVAQGTPEEVSRVDASHTGQALRAVLGVGPSTNGRVRRPRKAPRRSSCP